MTFEFTCKPNPDFNFDELKVFSETHGCDYNLVLGADYPIWFTSDNFDYIDEARDQLLLAKIEVSEIVEW